MFLDLSRQLVACLSVVALSVASGCTQPSQKSASSEAPTAVASASAAEGPAREIEAQPAASEVADADVKTTSTTTASTPQKREAAKPIISEYGAEVPPVLLSSGHAKLCKVKVGDEFPAVNLPALGSGAAEFAYGPKATVVVFWTTDRWMSDTALRDLAAISADGASVVGIAVGSDKDGAGKLASDAGAKFTQLFDSNGAAFGQVGEGSLPRVYVLDPQHHVAWFDIEYSEATRRELYQAIAALTK